MRPGPWLVVPSLQEERKHLRLSRSKVLDQPWRRWLALGGSHRVHRRPHPELAEVGRKLLARSGPRTWFGYLADCSQGAAAVWMGGSHAQENARAARIAYEARPVDAGVVQHGDDIGDALAEAVVLHLSRRVAPTVAAMVHQQVGPPGKEICVAGYLPHTAIATAAGVEEDRRPLAGELVVKPHAGSGCRRHERQVLSTPIAARIRPGRVSDSDQGRLRYSNEDPFATPASLRRDDRRFRGRLVAPVTVWTAGDPEERAGLTVSSVILAEGEPPVVCGVLDHLSDLRQACERTGRFVVQTLAKHEKELAVRFAGLYPGEPFEHIELLETAYGPVLAGARSVAYCRFDGAEPAGYYEIVRGLVDTFALVEQDMAGPLAYYRGEYRSIS
jgi:3-hydroxy-9,10-secoandrosta-1,3,5(10)-triene-9,17-dione monooxygenase reductase component